LKYYRGICLEVPRKATEDGSHVIGVLSALEPDTSRIEERCVTTRANLFDKFHIENKIK
jgi:hypothetical protein